MMKKKYQPSCVQCGKPLREVYENTPEARHYTMHRELKERLGIDEFYRWLKKQRRGTHTFGLYGNGWFCTKTCAFAWAIQQHGGFRGEVK